MRYLSYINFFPVLLFVTACNPYPKHYYDQGVVCETFVHRYGCEIPQERWTKSGENGKVITTLANGVVVTKNYSDGILEGDITYTFPHSSTVNKVDTYEKGILVQGSVNYLSGIPMQKVIYNLKGKSMTMWYENGAPKASEEWEGESLVQGVYYTPVNQIESRIDNGEGMRIIRDEYGQVDSKDIYQAGAIVSRMTFHPNGHPKAKIPFSHGLVNGQVLTFLPIGEPNSVETWVNGKQEGMTTLFQIGEKNAEVPYTNGKKHGVEKHFKDGNIVVEEITWVDGRRHGLTKAYLGSAVNTIWFFQDNQVSKAEFDRLNNPSKW